MHEALSAVTKLNPVFLISGTPGSGKTSIAQALLHHFPLGLHLPVDDFRELVVSGRASVFDWTEETTRQFELARTSAAATAARYAKAGFAVALDDVVFPAEAESLFVKPLQPFVVHKVLLTPRLEIALGRNAARTTKRFDTGALAETIAHLHAVFAEQEQDFKTAGWLLLDSSELTLEETVTRILSSTGYKVGS